MISTASLHLKSNTGPDRPADRIVHARNEAVEKHAIRLPVRKVLYGEVEIVVRGALRLHVIIEGHIHIERGREMVVVDGVVWWRDVRAPGGALCVPRILNAPVDTAASPRGGEVVDVIPQRNVVAKLGCNQRGVQISAIDSGALFRDTRGRDRRQVKHTCGEDPRGDRSIPA